MSDLDDHPTVRRVRAGAMAGEARRPHQGAGASARASADTTAPLDAAWLRGLCLEAGADDVGFVALDDPDIAE